MSGILTHSKSTDLAVLKAEINPQKLLRFLDVNKTGELSTGTRVAVVGGALAGNEGSARETTITFAIFRTVGNCWGDRCEFGWVAHGK